MYRGVAPQVLLTQVRNTAAWALEGPVDTPSTRWRALLAGGDAVPRDEAAPGRSLGLRPDYLGLLLAAHFATVGTFVPTDVDSQIRHHAWQRCGNARELGVLVGVLDGVDTWDTREVSARVVTVEDVGDVSGHDGEWLGVRAGALGRALQVGANDTADALATRIDGELDREARALASVADAKGRELDALRLCTTLAHNVGDLSRVVEEWPVRSSGALALAQRYTKLGHAGSPADPSAARYGGAFALAGHVNKVSTMALENHRFLALRNARGLRAARALLLPVGPFFDGWGEAVARHPALDTASRAAVVAALVEGHLSDTSQHGYLRALAGIHRRHPGGLDALSGDVPARLRRNLSGGAVREALGIPTDRFEARWVNRYRAARAAWSGT